MLEYDARFKLFAGEQFIQYDLHHPEEGIPEDLYGKVDICVIDPPFLNRQTNEHVAKSVLSFRFCQRVWRRIDAVLV